MVPRRPSQPTKRFLEHQAAAEENLVAGTHREAVHRADAEATEQLRERLLLTRAKSAWLDSPPESQRREFLQREKHDRVSLAETGIRDRP